MSKVIKSLLIVLLTLIIVCLIGTMVFFMKNDFSNFDFGATQMKLVDSFEEDAKSTDKILFDLQSADVEIKESENEIITVELYSNKDNDITVNSSDSVLSITENENNIGFFANLQKKVVLFVPAAYAGEYSIKTQSGDIVATNDLSKNIAIISTSSGDVTLNGTSNVNISTQSGDVQVSSISKRAAVSTSSGDININKADFVEASEITSSSGGVSIGTLDMATNAIISTSSGDVDIDNNISTCYVETETNSGDVEVNKSDRKSDIILKIKTSSGDIEVEG